MSSVVHAAKKSNFQTALNLFHEGKCNKAIEILKSTLDDDERSATLLGYAYYSGECVKRSYRKAKRYFSEAASEVEPWSIYYLMEMAEKGLGEQKNCADADRWARTLFGTSAPGWVPNIINDEIGRKPVRWNGLKATIRSTVQMRQHYRTGC